MGGEVVNIRVLVAFEDVYRAYRGVIAASIQVLRPQVEAATIGLDDLEGEVVRLDPHLVICSRDKPASLPSDVAWIKVPIDSGPQSNVTLETLLGVIDESHETRALRELERSPGADDFAPQRPARLPNDRVSREDAF